MSLNNDSTGPDRSVGNRNIPVVKLPNEVNGATGGATTTRGIASTAEVLDFAPAAPVVATTAKTLVLDKRVRIRLPPVKSVRVPAGLRTCEKHGCTTLGPCPICRRWRAGRKVGFKPEVGVSTVESGVQSGVTSLRGDHASSPLGPGQVAVREKGWTAVKVMKIRYLTKVRHPKAQVSNWQLPEETELVSLLSAQRDASQGPGVTNPGFRLRPRGRATKQMESAYRAMAGALGSGGLTSSSCARLWLHTIQEAGVKVLRSDRVELAVDETERFDTVLTLEVEGVSTVVSLEAYTRLATYVCYKPRVPELVPSLRTRASRYLTEVGHGNCLKAWLVPGTVALAMLVLPIERCGWMAMGGGPGRSAESYSDDMARGVIPSFDRRGLNSAIIDAIVGRDRRAARLLGRTT